MFFSEIFVNTTVCFFHKTNVGLCVVGTCSIWKLMEYKTDHSPEASIIPTF